MKQTAKHKNMKNFYQILIAILTTAMIISCAKKNTDNLLVQGSTGIIKDIEGNVYKTIKIGNQWWMTENLRTTKYRSGKAIPNVTSNTAWMALTTPAYCSYNNDFNTYGIHGLHYNWYVINSMSNGNENIAPEGWHVPSNDEFVTLSDFLGGLTVAGGKLKESGINNWSSPNTGATNSSGFTALPHGVRYHVDGTFGLLNTFVHWWSTTPNGDTKAWNICLINEDAEVHNIASDKRLGFSIICVKD